MREAGYEFNEAKTHAIWGKYEFTITKNKAGGSPKVQGEIKYWLRETPDHPVGDSDDAVTVLKYARKMGFVEESSGKNKYVLASSYVPDGSVGFKTVSHYQAFLRENPTVYMDLRQRVLEALIASSDQLEITPEGAAPAPTVSVSSEGET
jgi:hypothetical protein